MKLLFRRLVLPFCLITLFAATNGIEAFGQSETETNAADSTPSIADQPKKYATPLTVETPSGTHSYDSIPKDSVVLILVPMQNSTASSNSTASVNSTAQTSVSTSFRPVYQENSQNPKPDSSNQGTTTSPQVITYPPGSTHYPMQYQSTPMRYQPQPTFRRSIRCFGGS
jgi:hypothetical protein